MRGKKTSLMKDGDMLIDTGSQKLGGTQNRRQKKGERFAGMMNDVVWKYNPNSYYN